MPAVPAGQRPQPARATGARAAVERVSLPVLQAISAAPRAVPFLVLLAFLVAAVFVHGVVGALLTLPAIVFVGWLLYLRWPVSTASERTGRLAVLAVAVAIGLVQLFPKG